MGSKPGFWPQEKTSLQKNPNQAAILKADMQNYSISCINRTLTLRQSFEALNNIINTYILYYQDTKKLINKDQQALLTSFFNDFNTATFVKDSFYLDIFLDNHSFFGKNENYMLDEIKKSTLPNKELIIEMLKSFKANYDRTRKEKLSNESCIHISNSEKSEEEVAYTVNKKLFI